MEKKSQIRLFKKILIFSFILIGILSVYFVIAQIVVQNRQVISSNLINATAETSFTHLSINNNIEEDINATSAEHLDSNKNFISDIFAQIEHKDNLWSESISDGEFVKVTYQRNLKNGNSIDVYAKGEGWFEIYDSKSNLVGISKIFSSTEEWGYIVVGNLSHPIDTFYFKIKGSLQFDYIHDAATLNAVTLVNPSTTVTLNTGQTFAMNCTFGCTTTQALAVILYFKFNTTSTAWRRINMTTPLKNQSGSSLRNTDCSTGQGTNFNIVVNATTAGTYNLMCEGYTAKPTDINSTNQPQVIATDSTCPYGGTGNWAVTCSDNCVISSNVLGDGVSNFTATGIGRFVMTANISGFKNYRFSGGCNATCKDGGCIRI